MLETSEAFVANNRRQSLKESVMDSEQLRSSQISSRNFIKTQALLTYYRLVPLPGSQSVSQ